jgi:hypothetical protein
MTTLDQCPGGGSTDRAGRADQKYATGPAGSEIVRRTLVHGLSDVGL